THYQLFTPEARRALMSELLMQSSWYFAGRHMRRPDGSIPVKGDADFVPFEKRQFADPKNLLPSEELFNELEGYVNAMKEKNTSQSAPEEVPTTQNMPRRQKQDWELKEAPGQLFSKAWILPDGRPVQLGGQYHHEWINDNPDIVKQYGLKSTTSGEENRVDA